MNEFFFRSYEQFVALWYEYLIVARSLRSVSPAQAIGNGKTIAPLSIIFKGTDLNIDATELTKFYGKLLSSNEIETTFFLLFFSKAEAILSDIQPTADIWGDKLTFNPPKNGFFGNLSFSDYARISDQAVSQIRATRHIWMHNDGKIDRDYLSQQTNYFATLQSDLSLLPDYFFKESVRHRLQLTEGSKLIIDLEFLAFAQLFLLDRIFLKSGNHDHFFSQDGKINELKRSFELSPALTSEWKM